MFIQTESTPNPATLKFLPGLQVLESGTADFPAADSAGTSPLATRIFGVSGVAGVFLGTDFVTVTKAADVEWDHVKPAILGAILVLSDFIWPTPRILGIFAIYSPMFSWIGLIPGALIHLLLRAGYGGWLGALAVAVVIGLLVSSFLGGLVLVFGVPMALVYWIALNRLAPEAIRTSR